MWKILIVFTLIGWGAWSANRTTCPLNETSLRQAETELLKLADLPTARSKSFLRKVDRPLSCLLNIQKNGDGMLQYLASQFLRPFLGGGQVREVPRDSRYARFAEHLNNALKDKGWSQMPTWLAAHAEGDWSFYRGFCEGAL